MADTGEVLQFNGINGATGEYGMALTQDELLQLVTGESDKSLLNDMELKNQEPFPIRPDLDPGDLSQAGWGVIFHEKANRAIQEALNPLLAMRQGQTGDLFRIFSGDGGYRSGDSKNDFLSRHGVGPGLVDPELGVPYYLLIVGGPEEIPYDFQYQLDVQFAVGRIHFDTLDEYANYATSVVTAETEGVKLPRQVAFFGVANEDDRATQLSEEQLIRPLINIAEKQNERFARQGTEWEISAFTGEDAYKHQLNKLLNGNQAPALLFTASHGMEFPINDKRQIPHQGAILCQDWPGPINHRGPIDRDWYFSGEDISSDTNLLGLISFFFACYGAGTPAFNEFAKQKEAPDQIAPHAFLASLPVKMLGLSKGGALATIGHVERAWGHSIVWSGAGTSITSFDVTLRQLLRQVPIGYAYEAFNLRYAELATDLTMLIDRREKDGYDLVGNWTAHNDARSYVILGDPAVRLPVAQKDEVSRERPSITVADYSAKSLAGTAAPDPETFRPPRLPPRPTPPASAPSLGATEFGLFDSAKDAASDVGEAMKGFVEQMGVFLKKAIENASQLEVSTYTTEDMTGVEYAGGKFVGPVQLRAKTVIKIDGDTDILVPLADGEIDTAMWAVHLEAVKQAQESRNELVKTAVSTLTSFAPRVPGS